MSSQFSNIADFVFSLGFDALPDEVVDAAGLMLLDTVGVAAAATPMEAARIARDTASSLYATNDPSCRARLLFDGREVSIAGSGYAAATQTDNLDAHDGYNPVKGHIGVAVIPALIALAEHAPGLTGRDALALITLGYEIAGRAGLSLHATVSDYHTSGAWNGLGVASIAARLRGFDRGQYRHALGIAEYHGPRSQMMREIANPTMLHDGSGWGAFVGLSAVILAERGFAGAPAVTIESEDVAPIWADLGANWIMADQYVKPYPICRWAHAPIDGVRDLMIGHDIAADDIESITINSFREAVCLFQGMPDTTSKAQYAISFPVAVMALHGRIGLDHVSQDGLSDPTVAAMIDRIKVQESDIHNETFPHTRDADVTIRLKGGQTFDSGTVHARGGSERPMSAEDIIAKFHEFADPVLGEDRAMAIRQAALGLHHETASFRDLTRHLFAPLDR